MSTTPQSLPVDESHPPSPSHVGTPPLEIQPAPIIPVNPPPPNRWTDRIKHYFLSTDGRITLAELLATLICVILQHTMGTCRHSVRDGTHSARWHIFTPPFGAGPHTAAFFLVLSWIALAYCLERIWTHVVSNARVQKKRDLIVHSLICVLFLVAFGFNIWGYVLCESSSQVDQEKIFTPGVCRGDTQACIPLVAGILAACAAAFTFIIEYILNLTAILRNRSASTTVA